MAKRKNRTSRKTKRMVESKYTTITTIKTIKYKRRSLGRRKKKKENQF